MYFDSFSLRYDTGNLLTATKSYPTDVKPDLRSLEYSLNGGSIELTVIGSPETASEEQVSQSLGGANEYDLSWTESHSDFRVKILLTKSGSNTPRFSGLALKGIK